MDKNALFSRSTRKKVISLSTMIPQLVADKIRRMNRTVSARGLIWKRRSEMFIGCEPRLNEGLILLPTGKLHPVRKFIVVETNQKVTRTIAV